MTYPRPTVVQLVIVAVAMIVPLVWAFTHHGNTRKITLIFWLPLFAFVARVVYLNHSPTAPLGSRLGWAVHNAGMDPLTILWPAFVLAIYFLIWLFSTPRRRREAKVRQAATGAEPTVAARRQPPSAQPSAQAVPVQSSVVATAHSLPASPPRYTTCRHCGTAAASANARYCPGCGIELGYDPTQRSQQV